MKKSLVIFIASLLVLFLVSSISGCNLGKADLDKDINLVEAEFLELHVEGEEMSVDFLKELKRLFADERNIRDISNLKYAVNIEIISLNDNEISDVSPMKNLKNLRVLKLNNNNINDISALKNLMKLETLELNNNQVTDISVLLKLENLEELKLQNNPISDPGQIQELQNKGVSVDF